MYSNNNSNNNLNPFLVKLYINIYINLMLNSIKEITPSPSPVINIQYDPYEHQMSGMMSWLTR